MKINIYLIIIALFLISACNQQKQTKLTVKVQVKDSLYSEPISGKVLLLFSSDTSRQLLWGPNPFSPQAFYRYDFKNWDTKSPLIIKDFKNWWHQAVDSLNGMYVMQVIIDCNETQRDYFAKENSYSSKQIINLNSEPSVISSVVDKEMPYWSFAETELIKEEVFKSNYLSDFWKNEMFIKAGVVLPKSYFSNPEKAYPVVFVFPGFGSHHASITAGDGQINRYGMNTVGEEKIFVFCNGEFFQGYHHFADSENNGPWGKALTEEFIPYIENKYRVIKDQRFLMGQSSGAWTSIWLQVNYPDLFKGTFAASPDPIDFRAMGNNIYRDNANFYFSERIDSASLHNAEFNKTLALMEQTLDEYNQFKTWESTFSKKDSQGAADQLFDRKTGVINPLVAEQWRKYDIALIVKSKPDFYREKLKNKLHIFVSEDDDYGLDESIRFFKAITDSLDIKTDIQFFNDHGHNIWKDDVRTYIHDIIDKT